jgi:acetyl esterase/lipase
MMKSSTMIAGAVVLLLTQASLAAAPAELRLWEGVPPGNGEIGATGEIVEERGTDTAPDRRISGVTVPTVTVYLPPPEDNTGAALVICPGGGYSGEAIDKEGHDIARYLNTIGVAGIVLKYRLPVAEHLDLSRGFPSSDAARAIRLARHHAAEWRLQPDRIGIMGFSAGGHLAATVATRFDAGIPASPDPVERLASRPDFQVLVYPVISFTETVGHSGSRRRMLGENPAAELVDHFSNERHVTAATPPAFLVSTHDDYVKAENSLLYYQALRAAGVPAEMHVYEVGGHGYGIRPTGKPVATWHHRMRDWMQQRGLLEK